MTDEHAPSADECVGCERLVPQCDDLGLCPDCAAKLDRDMMRDRDWERSWTAWHTPADRREALRTEVMARYGARYALIAPPTPRRDGAAADRGKTGRKEMRMPQPERRKALPDHPMPAGLAAPDAWRLRVDGLVAQPLALSLSEVDVLGAQTHAADVVWEEGWMVPEQQWDGVAVAAILGRAGVQPEARFLKVYAGDSTVLVPLEEVLTGGTFLARRLNGTPLTPAHGAPLRLVALGRACLYSVKWVDRLDVLAEETPTTGETLARTRVQR